MAGALILSFVIVFVVAAMGWYEAIAGLPDISASMAFNVAVYAATGTGLLAVLGLILFVNWRTK